MDNNATHISIVLDTSGSMDAIKGATIEGYNSFILKNMAMPGKLTTMLTQFGSHVHVQNVQEHSIELLNNANYHPDGLTALYDAIGMTIDATGVFLSSLEEHQRPAKVIVAIVTDGQENNSRKFSFFNIVDMIEQQQQKYSWEFVFMGANQDAYLVAGALKIPHNNTMTYQYNNVAAGAAWSGMAVNTMSYRSGDSSDMSFTNEQVQEQSKGA